MIKISVDHAIAFDMLSILLIKSQKGGNDDVTNYMNFLADIKDEIGLHKLSSVLESPEFENLKAANKKVFDLVSLAKNDECLASEVDKANYGRYLCKQDLQSRHFNNRLTEKKLGY